MKEIYIVRYKLIHNGKVREIEGTATMVDLKQNFIIWADFSTGYLTKHNMKNIKNLIIKTLV